MIVKKKMRVGISNLLINIDVVIRDLNSLKKSIRSNEGTMFEPNLSDMKFIISDIKKMKYKASILTHKAG